MRTLILLLVLAFSTPVMAEETPPAAAEKNSTAVAAVSAKATQNYNPPDTTAALLKVTVGLGLVVMAIFGSAWAFRRFGGAALISNDQMRIIAGLSVGSRDRIILLQVGKEQIVVGISPGRIQTLHVMQEPIETEHGDHHINAMFADKLSAALKQWKKS